jgi:pyruvate kinase
MPTRAEVTDAAMGGRAECVMRNEGPFVVETAEFLARLLLRMQDHSHEKRSLMRRLRIAGPARTDPPTRTDTSAPA